MFVTKERVILPVYKWAPAKTSRLLDPVFVGNSAGSNGLGAAPVGAKEASAGAVAQELLLGPDDVFSRAACSLMMNSTTVPKAITAVSDPNKTELGGAKVRIDGKSAYTITLPAGKDGWVRLDEFHWEATLALFAPRGVSFELMDAAFTPVFDGPRLNGACPESGLTDYRAYFPVWTNALVKFKAQDSVSVQFMAYVKENGIP